MAETKWILYAQDQLQKNHKILEDQLFRSKNAEGEIDLDKLCRLVSQSYRDFENSISISNQTYARVNKELIEANSTIREQFSQYELVLSGSNDGIWDWDYQTQTVVFSSRWKEMLGYTDEYAFNNIDDWLDRIHPDYKEQVQLELNLHILKQTDRFECEYKIQHKNGHYVWMLARGKATYDHKGVILRVTGSQTDIGSQKEYQSQLAHAVLHDPLTGLPNRALLTTRLEHFLTKIARYKKSEIQGAILYINLDRFKLINDQLGHNSGDLVLKEFTGRLEKFLRTEDTLARFGGDEFIILLENICHIDIAEDIANRIVQKLNLPFIIDNEEIHLSASIGVCGIHNNKITADVILRNANMAMIQAKAMGRRRYFIFNDAVSVGNLNQFRMEKDLKFALEKNELYLLYQPIVDLQNDTLVGFEALIRWHHPLLGTISPNQFIPIAEEFGMIRPIGEYVLMTACKQLESWKDHRNSNGDVISLSINLSINQLSDPETVTRLLGVIEEYDFDRRKLKFELTESVLAQNIQLCTDQLKKFQELGIQLCIDDFGTGFSSFSYLDSFPFDILKIDRNFIIRMENDKKTKSMVSGLIGLSHNLQYQIIAEGVETIEQVDILKKMDCEYGQGYYFGAPMTSGEAESMLLKDSCVKKSAPKRPREKSSKSQT